MRAAALFEFLQWLAGALLDVAGGDAGFERVDDFAAADQEAARFEIDFAGIEALQGVGDVEADAHGVQLLAIQDDEADTFDGLAGEGAGGRLEPSGVHANAGQDPVVQELREFGAVNPIGADLLEGRVGAAAHRIVGRGFEQRQSG